MKNSMMTTVPSGMKRKLLLAAIGLFLGMAALEVLLQTGAAVIAYQKARRNRVGDIRGKEYRILCLGESTTDGQYPRPLGEILNSRNRDRDVTFKVIDCGRSGTSTEYILGHLEHYLDAYRPDMVVTMMGINDANNDLVIFEYLAESWYASLRSFKLIKILGRHVRKRIEDIAWKGHAAWMRRGNKRDGSSDADAKSDKASYVELGRRYREQGKYAESKGMFMKLIGLDPGCEEAYTELGCLYRDQGKLAKAEEMFRKAIELNPTDDGSYAELGGLCRDQGKYTEAEEMFKKAMAINPGHKWVYAELGRLYRAQGKYEEAEKCFSSLIDVNPGARWVYRELAQWYNEQKKYAEAEGVFKKAIDANPKCAWVYEELGNLYREQKKQDRAEKMFREAIELDPGQGDAYSELGSMYREQGKYKEAEEMFKKTTDINPRHGWAYAALGWLYKTQGKYEEAEKCFRSQIAASPTWDWSYRELAQLYNEQKRFKEAEEMFHKVMAIASDDRGTQKLRMKHLDANKQAIMEYYGPKTQYNYRKLKDIVMKRKMRLVCVQYPTRKLKPLRDMLEPAKGIIFVDNEKSFVEGVAREGYSAYFCDVLAESFGHCTYKGNRLLAENIATAITKELRNNQ